MAGLLLASLLLSLLFYPLVGMLLDDQDFFHYFGRAVLEGQVPYRDFFDHKPPMIFFINAAGLLIGKWGMWLIDTALAMLVTAGLYRRCLQYKIALPELLPLLFNLMLRDFLINNAFGLTREFTTFFILFFFIVLMGKSRQRHAVLGFLTGLVFFTQQEQIFLLLPFLIYLITTKDTLSFWQRFSRLAVSFLIVPIPFVIYFILHHALGQAWYDAFVFNATVYTGERKPLLAHFHSIKFILDEGNFELPFMISLVLGIFTLVTRNKNKPLTLAAIFSLFFVLTPEMMGGRRQAMGEWDNYLGYFVPATAAVTMLLFVVFAFTEESSLNTRKAQWPYAFLLCISLCYTALQHGTHLELREKDPLFHTPELQYLQQQQPKDYQLCVFGNDSYNIYYNVLNILAPCRMVYQHFYKMYPRWDTDGKELQETEASLLQHKTRWVLMDPEWLNMFINAPQKDAWMQFLQTHYQRMDLPGKPNSMLWVLK